MTRDALLNVEMTRMIEAAQALNDPEQGVRFPLKKDEGPGEWGLILHEHRPSNVSPREVLPSFTFLLEETVEYKLGVDIWLFGRSMPFGLKVGIIADADWFSLVGRSEDYDVWRYVALKYHPVNRTGYIWLFRKIIPLIERQQARRRPTVSGLSHH